MVALAPRSTSIHCGSLKALDQRVVVTPSVASAAGVPAFSVEDAVVGLPCDSSVPAAFADAVTMKTLARRVTAAVAVTRRRADRPLNFNERDFNEPNANERWRGTGDMTSP